ncbi:MAG: tRNA epoxyqueuosine(34) reductase QueG [Cytophagales bacterium]|nr:tRNA epoxyqueuosine(34) reductase QueG [Cytophagales bacterium]
MVNLKSTYTLLIKQKASQLGFDFCGISKAEFLEEEAPRLETWLNQNMHGKMAYMGRYFDKRLDPRKLVDGAKSVISLLLNYYPEKDLTTPKESGVLRTNSSTKRESSNNYYKISKYAYGKDYHFVLKGKLKSLLEFIREEIGQVNGRAFVDSAPVMDKVWAKKSGLGWVGKHTNLINRNMGSFFFIAELIVDLELEYDGPVKDYCGSCTRCMDACPTDAIVDPYVVDGSRCISYLTIELKEKEQIPAEFKGKTDNWIFGCDICQDVCPWNRFAKPHNNPEFDLNPELENLSGASARGFPEKSNGTIKKIHWQELTKELFDKTFKKSALKRAKFEGLKRNIEFVKNH